MGRRRKSGFDFDFIQKGTERKKEKSNGRINNGRKKKEEVDKNKREEQ